MPAHTKDYPLRNELIMNCQVKIGLFILKECGELADATCESCGTNICSKHSKHFSEQILCPECNLNQNNKTEREYEEYESGDDFDYDDDFYFLNRRSFYQSSQYEPFNEDDYNEFSGEIAQSEFREDTSSGSISDS
mgnify:CR=1 FL=1